MKKLLYSTIIVCSFLLAISVVYAFSSMTIFSGGTYLVEQTVEKGWNLLPVFVMPDYQFHRFEFSPQSELDTEDIVAVFGYSTTENKYYQSYPDDEGGKLGKNYATWVYVKKSGIIRYLTVDTVLNLEDKELNSGWNFVAIMPNMVTGPDPITDIQGTCHFGPIYLWDASQNQWGRIMLNEPITQDLVGRGIIIKVAEACHLGLEAEEEEEEIGIPSLPEQHCPAAEKQECPVGSETIQTKVYSGGSLAGCPYYDCCGDGTCMNTERDSGLCPEDCETTQQQCPAEEEACPEGSTRIQTKTYTGGNLDGCPYYDCCGDGTCMNTEAESGLCPEDCS